MNGAASFIVFIAVILSFVYAIIQMSLRHHERKLSLKQENGSSPALNAALAEIQALKERVQVLEKLATDDDRKLAGEIERLRRDQSIGSGS